MEPKDTAPPPLSEAIRQRREALGHSLKEAATAMDYRSHESARNVEAGMLPRERNIPAIASYLRWSQRRVRQAIAAQRVRQIQAGLPR